jgi:hypothetical protein
MLQKPYRRRRVPTEDVTVGFLGVGRAEMEKESIVGLALGFDSGGSGSRRESKRKPVYDGPQVLRPQGQRNLCNRPV